MIRVIRILEYEFPDVETYDKHSQSTGVPWNGTTAFGIKNSIVVRSAAILNLFPKEEGEEGAT